MKNKKLITVILGIIVCLLFISCNDDNNLKVVNQIDGDWQFVSPSSNGEFTIQDSTIVKGNFTVENKTYSIVIPKKITKDKILLVSSGDNNLALFKPLINSDLNTITCTNLEYDTDTGFTTYKKEIITITKK